MTTTLAENVGALARRFGITLDAGTAAAVGRTSDAVPPPHAVDPEAWVRETVMAGSPAAVILVGAGSGTLEALVRCGRPIVVVVAPDVESLAPLLERADWRAWIEEGRLAVLTGPGYGDLSAIARSVALTEETPIHVAPGAEVRGPGVLARACDAAERLRFESAANQSARRSLAGRYLVHTLSNAARIAREGDAARLSGVAAGVPAVIAAAGPSLDRDVHDLHVVRDRAILIACDTALRPLVSVGLAPQFAVALDPSLSNACHLGGLHVPDRTWLVGEGSLHPSAFAHFDRRAFFFRVADHHPWPWLRSAGIDCGQLEVWGSVVTAAFDLALRMGCSPVIFAGTDLAFTDGRPYCRGTTLEAQWAAWSAGGASYEGAFQMLVDGWPEARAADAHGRDVRTAPHLLAFRDHLVARAGRARVPVLNATAGGILHGPGITPARARDVLAQASALDLDAFHARVRARHRQPDRRAALFSHAAALHAIAGPAPVAAWRDAVRTTLDDHDLLAPLRGAELTAWALAQEPAVREGLS